MKKCPEGAFCLYLLLCCFVAPPVCCDKLCRAGEYLKEGQSGESDTCHPCADGLYQEQDHHRLNFCHWCSPFDEYDVLRRFVANCTKTHDTVTRCVSPDYYYTYDRDGGHCQKCTNCTEKGQHFGRNCSETTDAVCCEKDDMVIVNDTCASLPVYCGPIDILDLRPLGDVAKTVLCEDALKSFESRYCRASCESETNPGGNGGKTDSACNCSTTGSVDHTSSSNGLSGGAIAGIVVGVLGAFIVGVILGYFVRGRNCCRKRQRDPPTVDDPEEESQRMVGSNGEQTSV